MKLSRIYDADRIEEALKMYPFEPIQLDVKAWIEDENNIAIEAEDGSIGLFERFRPNSYDGHYFFKCRGREAVSLSRHILEELHDNYGVRLIRGFTPIRHKAAIWMSRHLGFTDMGEVPTEIGPCVLFVMNLDTHFSSIRDANA